MTKRFRIVCLTLCLALLSCMGVGAVFAKYRKEIPVGGFNLKINASFSGIITNQDELTTAINLKVDYTVNGGSYTKTVVADGVNVTIGGGATIDNSSAITVKNGGTVTINDATIVGSDSIAGTVKVTDGSNVVINGGTHSGWCFIFGDSNSSVEINGGTFDVEFLTGYAGMNLYNVGTLIIKGGTFYTDPTTYVADGYEAIDNGNGTWTVRRTD